MNKSLFHIEGNPCYVGYTAGQHWNGWACPYFTKEVAMKMAEDMADEYTTMTYNEANDSFIYDTGDGVFHDDYGPYEFNGEDINGMHLYPIGTMFWIWDDLADWHSLIKTKDGNLWRYLGFNDGFHEVTVVDIDEEYGDLTDTSITQYLSDADLDGAEIY